MSEMNEIAKEPSAPEQWEAAAATFGTPKKIIVCCDGTGNEFAGKDSKASNSNVVKFYTALKLDHEQFAYYHPGVGTLGDPSKSGIERWWSVIEGLAFGKGFSDNVLDAYRYLMQHYNSGDTVYLIGFSRGAYTARALAGLLHGYGLLCRGNEGHIPYAWRMYNEKVQDQLQQNRHTIEPDFSFRDTFCHTGFMLHFVGLWDTVSSVGWVSSPLRLLHLAQNPTIAYGRHAISVDERRCFYQDNLWGKPVDVQLPPGLRNLPPATETTPRERRIPKTQDLLQVWFSGVHSDVGGSYPQLESGLSNITLEWMMNEAENCGVIFDPDRRKVVLGKAVTPAEDPQGRTSSLSPLYDLPKGSPLHKSLTPPWWLLEVFPHRYYTLDDGKEKMRIPLGAYRTIPRGALVHASVKKRLKERACCLPSNLSLEEIQTHAPIAEPKSGNLGGYFVFEPTVCREGNWRENWLVVFAVSVLEIALGISCMLRLVYLALKLFDWLGHQIVWLALKVLPVSNLVREIAFQERLRVLVAEAASAHGLWRVYWLWPIAAAAVIVIANFILGAIRRART